MPNASSLFWQTSQEQGLAETRSARPLCFTTTAIPPPFRLSLLAYNIFACASSGSNNPEASVSLSSFSHLHLHRLTGPTFLSQHRQSPCAPIFPCSEAGSSDLASFYAHPRRNLKQHHTLDRPKIFSDTELTRHRKQHLFRQDSLFQARVISNRHQARLSCPNPSTDSRSSSRSGRRFSDPREKEPPHQDPVGQQDRRDVPPFLRDVFDASAHGASFQLTHHRIPSLVLAPRTEIAWTVVTIATHHPDTRIGLVPYSLLARSSTERLLGATCSAALKTDLHTYVQARDGVADS